MIDATARRTADGFALYLPERGDEPAERIDYYGRDARTARYTVIVNPDGHGHFADAHFTSIDNAARHAERWTNVDAPAQVVEILDDEAE